MSGVGIDGGVQRTLVWVDREGREDPLALDPAPYTWASVSPDGQRVAVAIRDPEGEDVWVSELARPGSLIRVTTDLARDDYPVWTPNGQEVAFASLRDDEGVGLFSRAADGTGPVELLHVLGTRGGFFLRPYGWSPDGRTLAVDYGSTGNADIGILSMEGDGSWRPLLQSEASESSPAISPGGTWLAYASDQSGQMEVYVERFPGLGDRQQISTSGGAEPLWSLDGRELFYRRGDAMMVVAINGDASLSVGNPEFMFEGQFVAGGLFGSRRYDISPVDRRFLMIKEGALVDDSDVSAQSQIILIQNWFDELQRLVPSP